MHIRRSFPEHLNKNPDFKIQISLKKNFNLKYFMKTFPLEDTVSNIGYPIRTIILTTPTPYSWVGGIEILCVTFLKKYGRLPILFYPNKENDNSNSFSDKIFTLCVSFIIFHYTAGILNICIFAFSYSRKLFVKEGFLLTSSDV